MQNIEVLAIILMFHFQTIHLVPAVIMMVLGSVVYHHWGMLEPTLTPQSERCQVPYVPGPYTVHSWEKGSILIRHEQLPIASLGRGLGTRGAARGLALELIWLQNWQLVIAEFRCRTWHLGVVRCLANFSLEGKLGHISKLPPSQQEFRRTCQGVGNNPSTMLAFVFIFVSLVSFKSG